MIKLGRRVRDRATGFIGITTAKVEYLEGSIQFRVQPRMTEPGKMPEAEWIDEGRLAEASTPGESIEPSDEQLDADSLGILLAGFPKGYVPPGYGRAS